MKFNSQICTTREQSERLIALGLKKETADIVHYFSQSLAQDWTIVPLADNETARYIQGLEIPAWSLGRLLKLIKHSDICNYNDFGCIKLYIDLDDFEACITMISYMVKEGYFNKEYLV